MGNEAAKRHVRLFRALARGDGRVARAASLRVDKEVFRVVELAVVARADAVDDAVLKVQQNGTRDVVLIIRLVKLCAEKSASTPPHASRALPQ